ENGGRGAGLKQDAGRVHGGEDVALTGVADAVAVGADHVAVAGAGNVQAIAHLFWQGKDVIAGEVGADVVPLDDIAAAAGKDDADAGPVDGRREPVDDEAADQGVAGRDYQAVGLARPASVRLDAWRAPRAR